MANNQNEIVQFKNSLARGLRPTQTFRNNSTKVSQTNYAANSVACKLWNLVGSPTELIFGVELFEKISRLYEGWKCWIYSQSEYQNFISSPDLRDRSSRFAIVPQLHIEPIGHVDFAIFIPAVRPELPLIAVECDGHEFHERTVEQASADRKRDRALLRLRVPVLRFTGTDIVRGSVEFAQEVAEFIDQLFRDYRSSSKNSIRFEDYVRERHVPASRKREEGEDEYVPF